MSKRKLFVSLYEGVEASKLLKDWISVLWHKIGQVEEWLEIGTTGAPAFTNGWVNVGGASETAAIYKDPQGRVHVKGHVTTGVAASSAFTLPVGYRPGGTIVLATVPTTVSITTSGLFIPNSSPSYIDGVSFRADA